LEPASFLAPGNATALRFHMEAYAEDLVRGGGPREEAMRRARLEFGGIERVKEEGREARGVSLIESLIQDLRYGAGSMRRTPGFTAVTAFTLALGIGAMTAIFSAVNPILFESLPYPGASRIMMISDFGGAGARLDVTFHTYRELSERSRSFEARADAHGARCRDRAGWCGGGESVHCLDAARRLAPRSGHLPRGDRTVSRRIGGRVRCAGAAGKPR